METEEKLVKAAIIADIFDMSVYTVYRAAKTGEIPSHKSGRSVRFSVAEVRGHMKAAASAASGVKANDKE